MDTKEDMTAWLYGLSIHGIKLGLRNIKELLHRLGDPQDSFRAVHVAGTDGKGSTCAMLASVLIESGIRTGLYTSPHILEFNERIKVNGEMLTDEELHRYISILRPIVDDMRKDDMQCTFFEVTTAMAFYHFREKAVEYAVVEVGMGGRFDATNIIMPELSIITNISMEHTEYLGDTIEKIAFEKAGIIKKGVPVITINSGPALDVIMDVASKTGADVNVAGDVEVLSVNENSTVMRYCGEEYTVGIPGDYQARNAEMVIEAAERIGCSSRIRGHLKDGLKKASWPCRLQKIEGIPLIIDGSHTKVGSKVMADNVAKIYGKVITVFGVLGDKDIDGVAENIASVSSKIIVTNPRSSRAADITMVEAAVRRYCKDVIVIPDIDEAIGTALKEKGMVLITGSFIMAEGALKWLKRTSA